MNITWRGSKNFSKRTAKIDRIVIHWFGVGTLENADSRFRNTNQASAHYGISKGRVYQWVDEKYAAWHAGVWAMNNRSIGIEHDAGIKPTVRNLSDQDYQLSGELVAQISKRWGIPLDRAHVIGHNQIKATQCPGTIDLDRIIRIAKQYLTPPPPPPVPYFPPLMYPITFRIKVIANNIANWTTLQSKLDAAAQWYKDKSGNKINLQFDIEHTSFNNIPFSDYDDRPEAFAFGVDKQWQITNILPRAIGYDMVIFHMRNADWDQSGLMTQGVMLSDLNEQKTMVINNHCDENENIGQYVFGSHFNYLVCHEVSHAFLGLTSQDWLPAENNFVTHKYFYTPEFVDAHKIFEVSNYQALSNVLFVRRGTMEPMIIINSTSNPGTKYALAQDAKVGFVDLVAFQKYTAGRQVINLTLPDVEFNKIPTSQAVIKT